MIFREFSNGENRSKLSQFDHETKNYKTNVKNVIERDRYLNFNGYDYHNT